MPSQLNASVNGHFNPNAPLSPLPEWASKRSLWLPRDASFLAEESRRHDKQLAVERRLAQLSPWRRKVFDLVESPSFERTVYALLVLNSLLLMTQNIRSFFDYQTAVDILDAILSILFAIEMTLKLIGLGIMDRQVGYFSKLWNWADGVITVVSLIGLGMQLSEKHDVAVAGQAMARALRLVRPLRMLTALSSMRSLLRALGASVIRLGNVALLTVTFLALMTLIALTFFRFIFHNSCQSLTLTTVNPDVNATNNSIDNFTVFQFQDTDPPSGCVSSGNATERSFSAADWAGLERGNQTFELLSTLSLGIVRNISFLGGQYGGVVCPYDSYCVPGDGPDHGQSNFDSILSASVLLYTIISLEGWSDIMFYTNDVLGGYASIYFVVDRKSVV